MIAMVHDNVELPMIEIGGLELMPGRKHKLSYKKRSILSLPKPYSDCTDTISPPMKALFNEYNGVDYAYSQSVCYAICYQTYT